jgi:hypothetical protein
MRRPSLSIALLFIASSASAQEQPERPVATKDVPLVVMDAVHARFPNARVAGVARETTEEGKDVYEVTLKERGRNIDVTTTLAGQLSVIEKEIARSELPAGVTKLLREKYPRATYKIVEKVTNVSGKNETLAFYELLIVDAKKRRIEVQVSPDGSRILKEEIKKPGEPN